MKFRSLYPASNRRNLSSVRFSARTRTAAAGDSAPVDERV